MKIVKKYAVVLFLMTAILFFIVRSFLTYQTKKVIKANIQALPHCCFETIQGREKCVDEFDSLKPIVIIYFHPVCEYCMYEAAEIGKNSEQFKNANMIFITPDTLKERVGNFALQYHLEEIKNLTILLDTKNMFGHYFGSSFIPSVYIYGPNRRLIVKYNGETKISNIIRYIN